MGNGGIGIVETAEEFVARYFGQWKRYSRFNNGVSYEYDRFVVFHLEKGYDYVNVLPMVDLYAAAFDLMQEDKLNITFGNAAKGTGYNSDTCRRSIIITHGSEKILYFYRDDFH